MARRRGGLGLFWASLFVLLVGVVITALAWIGLTRLLQHRWPWYPHLAHGQTPTSTLDITKVALSIVAGIGAAIALTVAYRRQRDLERGRFDERFAAAAAQLGADRDVQRLAGVYAIGVLADENPARRQQCIDLLCAYLRRPYDPTAGSLRTVVSEHSWSVGTATGKEQRTYEWHPHDREERHAIIGLILAHLRPSAPTTWSENDYDFSGVLFEEGDFLGVTFRRWVNFERATFSGELRFDLAKFSRGVSFDDATFSGQVSFHRATFSGGSFKKATFSGEVDFSEANLRRVVSFDDAKFSGKVNLNGANLCRWISDWWKVSFNRAVFSDGQVSFVMAKFGHPFGFRKAILAAGHISFMDATFSGGEVRFAGARFSAARVDFFRATFSGSQVSFDQATFFAGRVDFGNAMFSGSSVGFDEATFSGGAVTFGNAMFSGGKVTFDDATFSDGRISMRGATFSPGIVTRNGAEFRGYEPTAEAS